MSRRKMSSADKTLYVVVMLLIISLINVAFREIATSYINLPLTMKTLVIGAVFALLGVFVVMLCFNERIGLYFARDFKGMSIESMRKMNPYMFEKYVAKILQKRGFYNVQVTGGSNDGGKDIIAYDPSGKRVYVEVKRYAETNIVGRRMVQILHSAVVDAKADYGIFITTSSFNSNAKEYAKRNNIQTIDSKELRKWVA